MRFRGLGILRVWRSAKGMRKNAKLAAKRLRQVAIFPHNADPHTLRIATVPANAWETILFSDCLSQYGGYLIFAVLEYGGWYMLERGWFREA